MSVTKLRELIKDVKIAMLVTVGFDGMLRSRPLSTLDTNGEEGTITDLWFFTSAYAPKVDEITDQHQVNLSYSDPEHQRYISISGKATVSQDRERIHRLWKPIHKAWFPEGETDSSLTLIHVQVIHAEYWDAPRNGLVNAIGIAKALITGETWEPGDNEKLRFVSPPQTNSVVGGAAGGGKKSR